MHKFKLALCVLAMGTVSTWAQAATQGTVEFNGELIAETCQIVDGTEDITVTLPKMSTVTLASNGDEAGSKSFDIQVDRCDAALTQVAAHFEAIRSSGVDSQTGNLLNDLTGKTAATNAQIRLYDADGKTQLPVGSTGQSAPIKDQKATIRYYGGYYAVDQTTPGLVHAKVAYTLSYP